MFRMPFAFILLTVAAEPVSEPPPLTEEQRARISQLANETQKESARLKVLLDRYPLSAAKQAYDDFELRMSGRAGRAHARVSSRRRPRNQTWFESHATLEPMNCTVHVRRDECEIWIGSQAVARVQSMAAKAAREARGTECDARTI